MSVVINKCSRLTNNYKGIYAFYSTQKLNENIRDKRRAEVMARGLPKVKPIQGVKHVILVSSGKGGVGKTTTAVNLATCLKIMEPSKNVGLLDTDVFGPTVPLMMNLNDSPLLTAENLMEPLTNYGVKCMSMGFLIQEGSPVIWRGLMVMQALEKLLRQVAWDSIDYLIVDTPPGTGDTHLSLVQNIPISGVILVTTPQNAAIQVTKRGAIMYRKMNVPIIGILENMSSVICPTCSTKVFSTEDSVLKLAKELNLKLLEQISLGQDLCHTMDKGVPIAVSKPNSHEAKIYKSLAEKCVKFLENKC